MSDIEIGDCVCLKGATVKMTVMYFDYRYDENRRESIPDRMQVYCGWYDVENKLQVASFSVHALRKVNA